VRRPDAPRLRIELPGCEEKQADRRDQRRAVAAAVDAAMPSASEAERRAATAKQLHQDVTARAWAKVYDDDQEFVLDDLTRDQVLDWRTRAAHSAQRLFTGAFVATVQRLAVLGHLLSLSA
jgi:hypothetical protein